MFGWTNSVQTESDPWSPRKHAPPLRLNKESLGIVAEMKNVCEKYKKFTAESKEENDPKSKSLRAPRGCVHLRAPAVPAHIVCFV